MKSYRHTQTAPYPVIFGMAAVVILIIAIVSNIPLAAVFVFLVVAAIMAFLAFTFRQMTISDQGDYLLVQLGWIPIFGTRIRYEQIESASLGRSSLIDGWGIHYIPWRGWTYNLWGFECVELIVSGRRIRLGTDDSSGLLRFLESKIEMEKDRRMPVAAVGRHH